ncbi:MAG: hypothetical protein H7A34_09100 [bacterium]|nr:hypothetical protein [bacterium]
MKYYSTYGLTLASTLPFPELSSGKGKVDVNIIIAQTEGAASHEHSPILCVDVSPTRVHLIWGGVGDLIIEDSQRITVLPGPNADEDALRLFILGAGLGVLLHQRGLLVLHASGVVINDRVVGFIGAKGWGKSTTTAILHQRGYALISDELLVARFDDQGQPRVLPGSPQIRLWSDALVSTGGNLDSAVRVRSGIDKFNINALCMAPEDLRLHCLYLLDAGEELSIRPMSPSEAFFGVVPHLYVHRFGTSFLKAMGMEYTFQQLNQLLKKINVRRLLRLKNLNQLPDIAQRVEQDIFQEFKSEKP